MTYGSSSSHLNISQYTSAGASYLAVVWASCLWGVLLVLTAVDVQLAVAADSSAEGLFTPVEQTRIEAFGPWPVAVPADEGNEYSGLKWAEELGAELFFDTSLSGSGDIACATCHLPSLDFSDGRALAVGTGRHVRNTQSLLNTGLQRWFGWDGGADSLWAAALRPLLSDVEMANDITTIATRLKSDTDFVSTLRMSGVMSETQPLADEALVVVAAKAIAAYTRTLVSGPTPFDRYRQALIDDDISGRNAYPVSAKRGLKIFLGEANCSVCHFGPNFSNGEFHDTGRPFFTGVGQVDPGRYSGIKRVRMDRYNLIGKFNGKPTEQSRRKTETVKLGQVNFGQWRTPSLRNLRNTAPYMHDGSLETLRDVVDAYADIDPARLHSRGESILKPLALSDSERADLVAFLISLSIDD